MFTTFKNTLFKQLFQNIYKPGHYYSPVPNLKEIKYKKDRIFTNKIPNGIDLNIDKQIELLHAFKQFEESIPYQQIPNQDLKYSYNNSFFEEGDAKVFYYMLRQFTPNRVIEVGSGYSSALLLDTNQLFFNHKINCTFIEPYPDDRLNKLVKPEDNINLLQDELQNVDIFIFKKLKANDILFIDSSHISKVGSDVNYLFFEILPILAPGVIIHFHDICYPFEYPAEWIEEGRTWNEAYILKAFLMYNSSFEIICFNNYLFTHQSNWIKNNLSELTNCYGGSIWLRKLA